VELETKGNEEETSWKPKLPFPSYDKETIRKRTIMEVGNEGP